MIRFFISLAMAVTLLTTPANAKRSLNLNNFNCEDQRTKAYLEKTWKRMENNKGQRTTEFISQTKVISSKTRTKSKNKTSCSVRLRTEYGIFRGIFILRAVPNGGLKIEFHGDY